MRLDSFAGSWAGMLTPEQTRDVAGLLADFVALLAMVLLDARLTTVQITEGAAPAAEELLVVVALLAANAEEDVGTAASGPEELPLLAAATEVGVPTIGARGVSVSTPIVALGSNGGFCCGCRERSTLMMPRFTSTSGMARAP